MTRTPFATGIAPAWLAELQTHFGAALRTPLDRATGTLSATPESYPAELLADADAARLAVYNRQYWFRLFDVTQDAFPLTARLLGFWTFNHFAARYLAGHPPSSWDIDRVADDFAAAFAADSEAKERDDFTTLSEAALLDAAYRDVFRAPASRAYRPTAEDASKLARSRLVLSPALRIVREHSALVELRVRLLRDLQMARAALPPLHPAPRAWAIFRPNGQSSATQALPLETDEAELFVLLAESPLAEALVRLESALPTAEARALLPERTRGWLSRAVERGFFVGIADAT